MGSAKCNKCGEYGTWGQHENGRWYIIHDCKVAFCEQIGKKVTCKLCGKEGTIDGALVNGRNILFLKHYCPVKAKKKLEEKNAKIQKAIDHVIKTNGADLSLIFSSDIYSQMISFFPYEEGDLFDDFNEGEIRWKVAVESLYSKYVSYCEEKRKFPSKATIKRLIKEIDIEINTKN